MKFQLKSSELVIAKNRIKKVVTNSSLVTKSIFLKANESELVMYAMSEGKYGEIHLPCEVQETGFVEILDRSLDCLDYIDEMLAFELHNKQLLFNGKTAYGELNVVSTEPVFKEQDKPSEWIKLPKVVFDVLYCTTKDDNNFKNIFFMDNKIAATMRTAFAGYKHPTQLTEFPFTVQPDVFSIIPEEDSFEVAFGIRKIWFKVGEFYIGSSTIDHKNPIVTNYGYFEFDGENPFFEITLEESKRLCGYVQELSELGYAALVLNEGKLTVIPSGNEIGKGSIEFQCRSSRGKINFGTNTKNLLSAVSHVDAATCKVHYLEPDGMNALLVEGKMTRHLFLEVPSARYKE